MPLVSLLSESDDPRRPQARLNALKDITPDHGRRTPAAGHRTFDDRDSEGASPVQGGPATPRCTNSWPIRVRWYDDQRKSLEYAPACLYHPKHGIPYGVQFSVLKYI